MKTAVKIPSESKKLILSTDKRIYHDAIRVLRTLKPKLGKVYADGRNKHIRYKCQWTGMTIPQMDRFACMLNAIYKANGIKGKAYLHKAQGGQPWHPEVSLCISVPR